MPKDMKKYIWEVGVDIQTIYLFPEADTAEEAERLAIKQMHEWSEDWEGFDFDGYASSAQIEGVTKEYAAYVSRNINVERQERWGNKTKREYRLSEAVREDYTDAEILEFLIDIAEVNGVTELESYIRKTKGE